MNREQWLTEIAQRMETLFKSKNYPLKPYRVTCGWPCRLGLSLRAPRIGECHPVVSSKGGVMEIFVSPRLDKPLDVAGVVVHELTHVAVGTEWSHGTRFKAAMKALGLVGKPTSAMPGEKLNETLQKHIDQLGAYPHAALEPVRTAAKSGSAVKLLCDCGCNFRMSRKWLEESGVPICGCGKPFNIVEK